MSYIRDLPNGKAVIGYIGAFFLFIYLLFVLQGIVQVKEWQELHVPMILTVLISSFIIIVDKRTIPLGANTMVFIYSVLSLLGLMILLPWFPEIADIRSGVTMSFLKYDELIDAITLSCLGILTFVISTSIFSHGHKKGVKVTSAFGQGVKDLDENECIKYRGITFLGLMITVYCALFFLFLIGTNPGLLASGYLELKSVTKSSSIMSHSTVLMALSIVMVFTTGTKRDIKIASLIFAVPALINFAIGNRGEVYYPVLACIAVYTARKGTFKRRTLFTGIIGTLIIISFIRAARTIGVFSGGLRELMKTMSPIKAIAESIGEMGFQIGPFTYMLRYLNEGGSLQNGGTLVYSFQSFLYKYIPLISIPDPTSPAAIKTIMPATYFAFSNLSEAYFNFGIIGMLLFSILLAWYLVNGSKYIRGIYPLLFSNMFLVEIILWVRNSSATLPVYFAWTIVLLISSWVAQGIYYSNYKVKAIIKST